MGLTVYSSAEPWILAAKGPTPARARIAGPITRWLARASVEAARPLGDRAHRGDVGLDVAVELGLGQLREGLDLEALVGVFDVDRQQAADVGVVDLDPLDLDLAVLAEQVDLVAEPGQRRRQIGVVDVAAGAAQHVAVEEEDAHRCRPSY